MWSRIRSFTQPPFFPGDEQKTRQARLLNDVLLINLLSITAAFFVSLLYISAPKSIHIIILLVIPVILLLIGLMKAGHVNFASVATVLAFLFGVTGIAFFLGPHGTPILAYYLLAIVIAGLLLDSRALAAVTVFSVLAVGGMILREARAEQIAPPPGTAVVWLTYLVMFANTGLFIHLARRRYLDELSRRQQTEMLARHNEERYRTLAESTPDSIFIINRSGVLTYANSAAASILAVALDEAVGRGIETLLRFQDAHQVLQAIQKVFETCEPHQNEYLILQSEEEAWYDTKLVPICDNSGAVNALLGIAWNITERKQVEAHLKENAKELTALNSLGRRVGASLSTDQVIQAALEEIMPCLAPDLALLFMREGSKLTLRGINSSPAWQVASLPTPHQVGGCLCGLAAEQKEPVYSHTVAIDQRCQISDCKEAGMCSFAALPLLGKNEVIGVLGLGSSTERDFEASSSFLETIASQLSVGLQNALLHEEVQRHALELEARVRQRTAELETKNRELETFSYTVSHDLKAPLRGIDGYSRLLLTDHGQSLNSEGQAFLMNIRSGIARMSQLIDDLLSYSRLERHAIVRQEFDPRTLIDEILVDRLSDPNNRAEFRVELSPFVVSADPESLSQALRNLIDNAVKFSCLESSPFIVIGGWQDEQRSVLWVRDNGIGLDMRYADRIFEIFHRLNRDEDFPGTGVGLAIVRKAMEQMGGRAWVESILGEGASFYLELPKEKPAY